MIEYYTPPTTFLFSLCFRNTLTNTASVDFLLRSRGERIYLVYARFITPLNRVNTRALNAALLCKVCTI
jgi:hypothetical protein